MQWKLLWIGPSTKRTLLQQSYIHTQAHQGDRIIHPFLFFSVDAAFECASLDLNFKSYARRSYDLNVCMKKKKILVGLYDLLVMQRANDIERMEIERERERRKRREKLDISQSHCLYMIQFESKFTIRDLKF